MTRGYRVGGESSMADSEDGQPLGAAAQAESGRHSATAASAAPDDYRRIVEDAPLPIFLVQDGRYVYLNRRARTLTTRPVDVLTSGSYLDAIYPDDRPLIAAGVDALFAGQPGPGPLELRSVTTA